MTVEDNSDVLGETFRLETGAKLALVDAVEET
jgi:hypothetical protein